MGHLRAKEMNKTCIEIADAFRRRCGAGGALSMESKVTCLRNGWDELSKKGMDEGKTKEGNGKCFQEVMWWSLLLFDDLKYNNSMQCIFACSLFLQPEKGDWKC